LHFWIDRRLARFTEAITTNSTGVRDFYVKHGLKAELFRVIANGIEPAAKSSLSRSEALQRLQVDPQRRLILAVGRLWPQKRYRDLIWAGELTATVREEMTLVIIGDGPQSGELLRHRDAVSLPQRVRFAGQRSDVTDLLPHADLFWNASEYEGQSNALIEAMQAGVPVIASDIPGNRDLVVHDQTGRLFPLGDTADIVRQSLDLLENPDQAKRLADAAALRIASDFSVRAMVDAHAELYENGPPPL
jgi:glycosyltransferase involved in cell wall biosynthesis